MDCPPSSKQVGVFPSGVDNQLLLKSSVLKRAKEIRNLFPHRQIIFCRDTHVANVIRTLAAFSQLFSKDRYLMNHLVLIHLCSARVPASDLTAIPEIVRQINQLYGNTDFVPVHFYHQELDREEREALMAAADLGLFLGSQSSTLTSAKEFVLSQYERHAPLVMSQESSLVIPNGVITAIEDPSDIPALVTALHDTLTLCSIDSEKRYESLYKFVLENDAITCAHRFIETLVDHETRPLYTQQLIEAYKAASGKNLIIVCDNVCSIKNWIFVIVCSYDTWYRMNWQLQLTKSNHPIPLPRSLYPIWSPSVKTTWTVYILCLEEQKMILIYGQKQILIHLVSVRNMVHLCNNHLMLHGKRHPSRPK